LIREVEADDWERLRDVRLRALSDAPHAFASTLERERVFPDEMWQDRAAPNSDRTSFVAGDDAHFDALVTCFVEGGPDTVYLVAMWVAPELRGHGVAVALIDSVVGWSRDRAAQRVCLTVERGNEPALRLYRRCGFHEPETAPDLPYDPGADSTVLVREL
jgi:GNAT superfamily N-acetyltransferase